MLHRAISLFLPVFFALFLLLTLTLGDGPADNKTSSVRPMPPSGIMITPEQRSAFEQNLKALEEKIQKLQISKPVERRSEGEAFIDLYLPDVEIFARAVRIALNEDGFFEAADANRAIDLLKEGAKRADELATVQRLGDLWRERRLEDSDPRSMGQFNLMVWCFRKG